MAEEQKWHSQDIHNWQRCRKCPSHNTQLHVIVYYIHEKARSSFVTSTYFTLDIRTFLTFYFIYSCLWTVNRADKAVENRKN